MEDLDPATEIFEVKDARSAMDPLAQVLEKLASVAIKVEQQHEHLATINTKADQQQEQLAAISAKEDQQHAEQSAKVDQQHAELNAKKLTNSQLILSEWSMKLWKCSRKYQQKFNNKFVLCSRSWRT